MIEIKSPYFENDICLKFNKITVLEINNKVLFRNIIRNINLEIINKESISKINFYEGDKKIEYSKDIFIIQDLFNIDLNNLTILKNLYLKIENDFIKEGNYNCFNEIYNKLYDLIKDLIYEYDFPFTFKENIKMTEYLKFINLKFSNEELANPIENIYYLYEIINNLKICKILILVNIKAFFTEEELIEIYKMAIYKGINIFLIESTYNNIIKEYEQKIIIDENFEDFLIN